MPILRPFALALLSIALASGVPAEVSAQKLARHAFEDEEHGFQFKPPDDFTAAVARVIAATGPGEVVTYGEVATEAGFPGAARAVGAFLARSPGGLPWWRVVTASGRLVPGHEREHARLLRAEGVATRDGRVARPARSTRRAAGRAGRPSAIRRGGRGG